MSNKVLNSPHFDEIHKKLCEGETYVSVSRWLKETYGESISQATIGRYAKRYVNMDQRVEYEANSMLARESTYNKLELQNEEFQKAGNLANNIAKESAEVLIGVTRVAKCFERDYENLIKQAMDTSNDRVTWKDVSDISFKAAKVVTDFAKSQETNIEINLLDSAFDVAKIRGILEEKKNE